MTGETQDELTLAMSIAKKAHANQLRKFDMEPYVNHPIRVSNSCVGDREKAVALLHDVLEDMDLKVQHIVNAKKHKYHFEE
jgi:(p)ppGpp synthase/HD superfamily hydrolase